VRACSGVSLLAAVLGLAIPAGCDRDDDQRSATPVESAAPSSASAVPSASAAPAPPWFLGAWSATVTTRPYRMGLDKKAGAPAEWSDDEPPSRGIGEVALSIDVDEHRNVTGSGTGALGNVRIAGTLEGDTLKARVLPVDADAFRGSLVAVRKDDSLEGTLKASSSDSLVVTHTPLTLGKDK
jgi:hypothetical protein